MTDRDKPIEFDHHSKEHSANWIETYRRLRATCPVARTESHGGYWVITRYDDVSDAARAPDIFSSAKWQDANGKWQGGNTLPTIEGRIIPDETDPPEWRVYRRLLNPWFTPKAIERSKGLAQLVASILVDSVIEAGEVDIVDQLANPMPAIMTLRMLGLSLEHWREYAEASHEAIIRSQARRSTRVPSSTYNGEKGKCRLPSKRADKILAMT
jgi:cytochrome P450